jgi:hypothetical protein
MNALQNWIQLDPAIAFLLMATVFLVVSVAGWYIGEAILWVRTKMRSTLGPRR